MTTHAPDVTETTMLTDAVLRRMETCATRHTLTGWYGGGEWQEMYEHDVPPLVAELRALRQHLAAVQPLVDAAREYQAIKLEVDRRLPARIEGHLTAEQEDMLDEYDTRFNRLLDAALSQPTGAADGQ